MSDKCAFSLFFACLVCKVLSKPVIPKLFLSVAPNQYMIISMAPFTDCHLFNLMNTNEQGNGVSAIAQNNFLERFHSDM